MVEENNERKLVPAHEAILTAVIPDMKRAKEYVELQMRIVAEFVTGSAVLVDSILDVRIRRCVDELFLEVFPKAGFPEDSGAGFFQGGQHGKP